MAKVLVIGSGGREHALCWRLKQSPQVSEVFCAPGNGGIAQDVACVAINSPEAAVDFCKVNGVDLVVVGPEQPLVDGWADVLAAAGIATFGSSAKASQLEGSKGFMKDICKKYHIPTADYARFTDAGKAKAYLDGRSFPIVIKADGLAAGKGVIIAQDRSEAETTIDNMFAGQFGESSKSIVIEEFMTGREASFFAICDGEKAIAFGSAQDHKRAFDNDEGPNTGGMGTFCPTPYVTPALEKIIMETIVQRTVDAMKTEGAPFKGVLFAGLMLTEQGPKLIEFNVRFGDPETQTLMMRYDGDLYQTLLACAKGELGKADIRFDSRAAVCVVMAANGYPGDYEKGSVIRGLDAADALSDTKIFHAGTKQQEGNIVASGGRVLGVTALGHSIDEARANAYKAVRLIDWPQGFCRSDIAKSA